MEKNLQAGSSGPNRINRLIEGFKEAEPHFAECEREIAEQQAKNAAKAIVPQEITDEDAELENGMIVTRREHPSGIVRSLAEATGLPEERFAHLFPNPDEPAPE